MYSRTGTADKRRERRPDGPQTAALELMRTADVPDGQEDDRTRLLTLAVDLRVLPEAILHSLEFLHAVHPLWLGFRVDEA